MEATNRITRRAFLRTSGTVLAAGVLAACAPAPTATPVPPEPKPAEKPTAAPPPTPAPAAKVELEFWMDDWIQETWTQLNKEFSEKYADQNVTLKMVYIPYADLQTKVLTALAAGAGPDNLYNHPLWAATYLTKGVTNNHQDLLDASGVDPKDWIPGATGHLTWKGQLGGLPMDNECLVFFYNKDLLQKKGLTDPYDLHKAGKGEWNYDTFFRYVSALTEGEGATKIYGTSALMPFEIKVVSTWLWGYGAEVFSQDYSETLINSPKAIEAWNWMNKPNQEGWAPTPADSKAVPEGVTGLFNSGRLGFHFSIRGYLYRIKLANAGVCPVPIGPVGAKACRAGIDGISVFSQSKKKDLAGKYCIWVATRGNELIIAAKAGSPNRWSTFKKNEWLGQMLPWEHPELYEEIARDWERTLQLPPFYQEMNTICVEAQDKVRLKTATTQEAMDLAKKDIDAILKEGAQ